jgi:adenylosuccinate synthase
MKKAQIVIGLGFGDEGKGITTDFLAQQNPESVVIRFSGGQQAAHTVMIDDKKHIHSSTAWIAFLFYGALYDLSCFSIE